MTEKKTKMFEVFRDLYNWIEETLFEKPFDECIKIEYIEKEEEDLFIYLTFWSENNEYEIYAVKPNNSTNPDGYFKFSVRNKNSEDFEDLMDGPYNYATWIEILRNFLKSEIKPLTSANKSTELF